MTEEELTDRLMETPRLAKLATDLLAEERASRAPSSEAEMRAVAAIEGALARRRRSRRIVQVASAFAMAAVIAAVFVGYRRNEPQAAVPAPTLVPSAVPSIPLSPPVPSALAEGDRIVAAEKGGTSLALADGSVIRIEPQSELSVKTLSSTRRFLLTRGSLHADVAKLGAGERFIVETEDTEVEVHGTSFVVAIREATSGCPSHTRVEVAEGIVSVRSRGHEDRLHAGESWPACAVAAPPRPSAVPSVLAPITSTTASIVAPTSAPASSASSMLAAQNALFAKANAARRAGDGPGAVAAYDRLISEYPDGFLAESAAVERMRVLEGMDHTRGREAAATYLTRYPNGFARAEAERIAH